MSKTQWTNIALLLFIFFLFFLYFFLLFIRKQLKLRSFLSFKQQTIDTFKNNLDKLDKLIAQPSNKKLEEQEQEQEQEPNFTQIGQQNNGQEQISISIPISIPIPITYYRELYQMYINGVHDTYDINQNKIIGIRPNAEEAIKIANEIISMKDHNDRDLLNLASIYKNGMHNFEPNLNKAEEIYNYLINNCSSEDVFIE